MKTIMLGVGDYGASRTIDEQVKTMALGSCVAVIILHPKSKSVGMVHVALPDSKISPDRARERPGYFADTGVPVLLQLMSKMGCSVNPNDYIVKLAGGANVMDKNNTFNIGKRNVLAIKKVLWHRRMGAISEDVGGSISRTVAVDVNSGRTIITCPGRGKWEI